MIETHPFGIFIPPKVKYLLLGSFTTKEANFDPTYDWFYGTKKNQFWKIMRAVYNRPLENKKEKQSLFTDLEMALGDVIYQCERLKNSNLDVNLVNIVYNTHAVEELLNRGGVKKIFFSSKFVEHQFHKHFQVPNKIGLVSLPSPSPRYAILNLEQKVAIYERLLPKIIR